MDWRRAGDPDADDPSGVAGLLAEVQAELGQDDPLLGTRFLHDATEMLRATRMIEHAVEGVDTTLYIGFQNAGKLDGEAGVYTALGQRGTRVLAFGTGHPANDVPGVRWCPLDDDPLALENQWFLITRAPEPIAFVGYETTTGLRRGQGGARAVGKSWEGFISADTRVIDSLVARLDQAAADAR